MKKRIFLILVTVLLLCATASAAITYDENYYRQRTGVGLTDPMYLFIKESCDAIEARTMEKTSKKLTYPDGFTLQNPTSSAILFDLNDDDMTWTFGSNKIAVSSTDVTLFDYAAVNVGIGGYIDFDEISIPASPSSDIGRLYVKDNGSGTTTLYFLDSAGIESSCIAAAAGVADLDEAYDGAGAGSGRTIDADSGAVAITVSDEDDNVALIVTQNDNTNDPNAVQIVSTADAGTCLDIDGDSSGNDITGTDNLFLVTGGGALTAQSAAITAGATVGTTLGVSGATTLSGTATVEDTFTASATVDLGAEDSTVSIFGSIDTNIRIDDSDGAAPTIAFIDGSDETATFNKIDSGVLDLITQTDDGLRISGGNLRIGDGTPTVAAMTGGALYVKTGSELDGLLDVAGAITAQSTLTVGGVLTANGTIVLEEDQVITGVNNNRIEFQENDEAFELIFGLNEIMFGAGSTGVTHVDFNDFEIELDNGQIISGENDGRIEFVEAGETLELIFGTDEVILGQGGSGVNRIDFNDLEIELENAQIISGENNGRIEFVEGGETLEFIFMANEIMLGTGHSDMDTFDFNDIDELEGIEWLEGDESQKIDFTNNNSIEFSDNSEVFGFDFTTGNTVTFMAGSSGVDTIDFNDIDDLEDIQEINGENEQKIDFNINNRIEITENGETFAIIFAGNEVQFGTDSDVTHVDFNDLEIELDNAQIISGENDGRIEFVEAGETLELIFMDNEIMLGAGQSGIDTFDFNDIDELEGVEWIEGDSAQKIDFTNDNSIEFGDNSEVFGFDFATGNTVTFMAGSSGVDTIDFNDIDDLEDIQEINGENEQKIDFNINNRLELTENGETVALIFNDNEFQLGTDSGITKVDFNDLEIELENDQIISGENNGRIEFVETGETLEFIFMDNEIMLGQGGSGIDTFDFNDVDELEGVESIVGDYLQKIDFTNNNSIEFSDNTETFGIDFATGNTLTLMACSSGIDTIDFNDIDDLEDIQEINGENAQKIDFNIDNRIEITENGETFAIIFAGNEVQFGTDSAVTHVDFNDLEIELDNAQIISGENDGRIEFVEADETLELIFMANEIMLGAGQSGVDTFDFNDIDELEGIEWIEGDEAQKIDFTNNNAIEFSDNSEVFGFDFTTGNTVTFMAGSSGVDTIDFNDIDDLEDIQEINGEEAQKIDFAIANRIEITENSENLHIIFNDNEFQFGTDSGATHVDFNDLEIELDNGQIISGENDGRIEFVEADETLELIFMANEIMLGAGQSGVDTFDFNDIDELEGVQWIEGDNGQITDYSVDERIEWGDTEKFGIALGTADTVEFVTDTAIDTIDCNNMKFTEVESIAGENGQLTDYTVDDRIEWGDTEKFGINLATGNTVEFVTDSGIDTIDCNNMKFTEVESIAGENGQLTDYTIDDRIEWGDTEKFGINLATGNTVEFVTDTGIDTIDCNNMKFTEVESITFDDTTCTSRIMVSTVELSNVNIKNLVATSIEIVATPGADKMIVPIEAILILQAGSEVLTEGAGDELSLNWNNGTTQAGETIETTGFIDQAVDTITNWHMAKDEINAASLVVNKNLTLDNAGGTGEYGGNVTADATMTVTLFYRIITCGL